MSSGSLGVEPSFVRPEHNATSESTMIGAAAGGDEVRDEMRTMAQDLMSDTGLLGGEYRARREKNTNCQSCS